MAGIFSRILTPFRRFFGISQRSTTIRTPSPWILTYSKSGAAVGEKTTIGIAAVWRGLDFIASAMASMPLNVVEEGQEGNITYRKSHPIQALLSIEPHPNYSAYDFRYALAWEMKLRGNGVAVIERGRLNRPTRLNLVKWADVMDVNTDKETGYSTYKIKGYAQRVMGYDVIHWKNATDDGICGLDTLKVHMDNFGLDLASRDVANYMYKNGAMINGYLTTDKTISPDSRESMEKSFNAKFGGPENAGFTPIFEGGLKYDRFSLTPHEAGLNDSRQFNVYEVARILGISPHVLFALDRANFSNIETLHQEIGKYTLAPAACSLESELNRKLFTVSEIGRIKTEHDLDSFTRGDTKARAEYIKQMVQNGIFTINEARRMEGKNSVPYGDAFLVPQNMLLVGMDGTLKINPQALTGDNSGSQGGEGGQERKNGAKRLEMALNGNSVHQKN